MISSPFMKMDELPNPRSGSGSFGFLRNRRFLLSMSIMFFYLCVEASVMGWMVTYYADSGAVAANAGSVFGEYPLAMGGLLRFPALAPLLRRP